jgi:hypothetical protein
MAAFFVKGYQIFQGKYSQYFPGVGDLISKDIKTVKTVGRSPR